MLMMDFGIHWEHVEDSINQFVVVYFSAVVNLSGTVLINEGQREKAA